MNQKQALIEKGVDGKADGKGGKYESHTSVADITIIFADTRLVLVKMAEASGVASCIHRVMLRDGLDWMRNKLNTTLG